MAKSKTGKEVPIDRLRWSLPPDSLPFKTTDDIKPLEEIVGQKRGVEAFRFGTGINKPGYNVFVTGIAQTGRLSTIRKLLHEITSKKGKTPDDLCYVNNFKTPEAPILIRLPAGSGIKFQKELHDLVETLKKDVPGLFEGQDYINKKKAIMEEYENKGKGFFKELDKRVRSEGFALVDIQIGQIKRQEVMPLVDGNPVHIDQVEEMVEKGRFPKEEFGELKKKHAMLRAEIDQIFLELRDLQKEIQRNTEDLDRLMFMRMATNLVAPIKEGHKNEKVSNYLNEMLEDMSQNLKFFMSHSQEAMATFPFAIPQGDPFQPYRVNLLVDNSSQKGPPVIVESYPTYRNLFGSIERIVDRSGIWRTDFSMIKAGSFVKANGGYLVLNLLDAAMEPGVWPALKRSLKTNKMEIQTYDPFYLFTTTGLKPEPIEMDAKVVVISNTYLYHLLMAYDEDVPKIFKVRADFDDTMERNEESILKVAEFIKMKANEGNLRPFDRSAVAALVEQAVRMAGQQEKISTSFPLLADIILEADYWAGNEDSNRVTVKDIDKAIESRIYRSNMIQEHMQEMIDRGTLMIDVDGEVVGQVNGLSVYNIGGHIFGKPSRITASTSMGRAGIINIEREADMSGSTHNKGVLILGGYLRNKYAQDKPMTISASIAFEQSYGGVDGDSASSTEIYALLSSLSGVPVKQYIAITGSINQKGEVQAIGGVNEKIEGFYDCCRIKGLTGRQGVMIPENNIKDLMLRKDVVEAVKKGKFHVWAVKNIDEGIEILTDKKAGQLNPDSTYPRGTINYLVNQKLMELAEGLSKFGKENNKEDERKNSPGKGAKQGS